MFKELHNATLGMWRCWEKRAWTPFVTNLCSYAKPHFWKTALPIMDLTWQKVCACVFYVGICLLPHLRDSIGILFEQASMLTRTTPTEHWNAAFKTDMGTLWSHSAATRAHFIRNACRNVTQVTQVHASTHSKSHYFDTSYQSTYSSPKPWQAMQSVATIHAIHEGRIWHIKHIRQSTSCLQTSKMLRGPRIFCGHM